MKNIFSKLEKILFKGDKKKAKDFLISLAIIGIIIILAANVIFGSWGKNNSSKPDLSKENTVEVLKTITSDDKDELQKRVEGIISKIEGAGNVSVLITYYSGKELVPAFDTKKSDNDIQEKDTQGGTRNTKKNDIETNIVYEEQQGSKKPLIVKELMPQVKGVLVVAEGANEPVVKENIVRSVQVLLDVQIHKIQVVQKGK